MKVWDLRCDAGHVFEGWFSSEADYQQQRGSGILVCPVCESAQIEKGLSAPRLNAKSNQQSASQRGAEITTQPAPISNSGSSRKSSSAPESELALQARMQAQWLDMARQLVAQAEDVGGDFANEARRIHEGDAPERPIHGQASAHETQRLLEDGIPVLPLPEIVKKTVQ